MTFKIFTTEALEGFCTQEQLDPLDSIDKLRSQGISHYVSLPQIIVCGNQSSGKSSVLEAISGVSFPVKSSLCTRFPTELVLRKNSQVGVRVSIVPHQSRSDAEQRSLGSFCEQLDGFDGLANLVENAKAGYNWNWIGSARVETARCRLERAANWNWGNCRPTLPPNRKGAFHQGGSLSVC